MTYSNLSSFYIVTIIIIIICFLYILIFYSLIPVIKNTKTIKKLKNNLKDNNISYKINKNHSDGQSFDLIIDDKTYLVKLIDIKKNSELVVNSLFELVMYYQNIVKENKAKVIEQSNTFISLNKDNKVILANSDVKEVKHCKNKMETITLNPKDKVEKTHIIDVNDFIQIIK